jgi:hypothetical protein
MEKNPRFFFWFIFGDARKEYKVEGKAYGAE